MRVAVTVSVVVAVTVAVGVRVAVVSGVGVGVGVTVGGTGRNVNCHEARILSAGSDDGHCSVSIPWAIGKADWAMATE